jgi:hypothetical protein
MTSFPDFTDRRAVIAFAAELARRNPQFRQFVVKYPDRAGYNVTMQVGRAVAAGAAVVWQSAGGN